MRLADYLKDKQIKPSHFADQIGKSAATVSRILRGLNTPDWKTMRAIESATDGAVTPNDFRPDEAA